MENYVQVFVQQLAQLVMRNVLEELVWMDAQCLTLACQRPLALMEQQFVQHHALFPVLKTICTVMVALMSMDVKSQTPVFQKKVYNTYISLTSVTY